MQVEHEWLDRLPLPAGIIRAGRYLFVNTALLELLQLPRETVVGMAFDAPVAAEHRPRIRERHEMRLRGEPVPSSYEFDLLRASGERRTVEIFVSLVDGDTFFQLHDVTERAHRRAVLQGLVRLGAAVQREQNEADIFRAAGLGLNALGATMVRFHPEGKGVRLADGYNLHGPDPIAGVLGREAVYTLHNWTPNLTAAWADGHVFLDDVPLSIVRYLGNAKPQEVRMAMDPGRHPRGAMVRVDVAGGPRDILLVTSDWVRPEDVPALSLFGAQVGAALDAARTIADLSRRNAALTALDRVATSAGTARDQSQLFESASAEVMKLLQAVAVAVFLIEENGEYGRLAFSVGGSEEANRTFSRVPLASTNLGKVAHEGKPHVWRAVDYDELRQGILRRMGQEVVASVPLIIRSRVVGIMNVAWDKAREVTGRELEVLAAMAVHLAAANESNRLIEDLRHSYSELSRAQAQLVQRERLAALGEMAAVVAHEVRNPLGVIFNSLVTLRRELSSGRDAEPILGILTEESERINHLVSDLLEFARPTQPELGAELPLRTAVEEAVETVIRAAPAKVDLAITAEPGLEKVPMDARLMRQVFVNLAENAIQAMPQGGALEVRLGRDARAGVEHCAVQFRDSGVGIPPEILPRIFEPFFTTRAKGTGLGLALVKRIVEGHRGEVEVESAAGVGTTFTVRWPIAEPQRAAGWDPRP
ncbi:MAG: PAS domain S-box protein [Deltaproteobacteria bacterium]|nr:PAS domain S-box protein [Deltaproteobacteria bacterium]